MNKIKALVEIVRPINILIAVMVYYVAVIICSDDLYFSRDIILGGLSVIFAIASGNIINDYFDINTDIINRPNRPLPSKRISQKEVAILNIITTSFSISTAFFISTSTLIIVIAINALLILYSRYFKRIPFVGNLTIAFCTGMVFIYGGIIAENISYAIIPAIFAFLINLIREILKDIEDIDGDRTAGISTIPIKFGILYSIKLIALLSIILVSFTFYPFLFKIYKIEYFILILFLVNLPVIFFIKQSFSEDFKVNIPKLSILLKVIMIFGLFSIYIGAN